MILEAQTAPAPAADNTPLTLDQAADIIAAKSAQPAEPKQKRPKAPEPEQVAEEIVDDTVESPEGEGETVEATEDSEAAPQAADDGEEAPETDTLDAEQEQEPDPAEPTLEAPARWEAEDKALFATLPKKAQETILRREKLQQAEVTKAQQKSAEAVKAVETRITHLNTLAAQIGENYVEPGQARMQDWQNWFASPDARELAETDPGAFLKERMRYEQEGRALQDAIKAKHKAEQAAFAEYAAEQAKLIPELVPELADEVEGPKRKTELLTHLRETGFDQERIRGISALEAKIAWESMQFRKLPKDLSERLKKADLYDKSLALAKKAPPPQPKAKAGPSAPVAGQGQTLSSSEARLKTLSSKKSLSAEEHTELMMLKAKSRK